MELLIGFSVGNVLMEMSVSFTSVRKGLRVPGCSRQFNLELWQEKGTNVVIAENALMYQNISRYNILNKRDTWQNQM